jgi:hypothetical protein
VKRRFESSRNFADKMKKYTTKQEIEKDINNYELGPITFLSEQKVQQVVYLANPDEDLKMFAMYEWSLSEKLKSFSKED